MDEVSCSFSTTCRFDVYIWSFAERKNIYNTHWWQRCPVLWVCGSMPFHASAQRCWRWGGAVWKVEMQKWGFMHAQVKVYLGSVWGSSKGWVWLVRGRVRKWLQSHGRKEKDRDGSEMQLREKQRRRNWERKFWRNDGPLVGIWEQETQRKADGGIKIRWGNIRGGLRVFLSFNTDGSKSHNTNGSSIHRWTHEQCQISRVCLSPCLRQDRHMSELPWSHFSFTSSRTYNLMSVFHILISILKALTHY